MRTVKVRYGAWIPIGRIGENETTEVVFDISGWKETFGDNGTFEVLHQRPGDSAPYLCTIREDDNSVIWIIKNTDLAYRGHGVCNLIYTVDNKVAKSDIFTTVIGTALIGGPTPPEPWTDWVERVIEAGRKAEEAKAQWENMSAEAETLPAGTPATASYSGGVLSLGIPTGAGVPDGGTAGQLLSKTESGTKWIDPPQSAVQSDWNQNDSTAADYVKNRPFYTGDSVETVLVEESTVAFALNEQEGLYMAGFPSTFEATIGETYKVSWDGTAYECICASFNSIPAIGNLSIAGAGSDTGEPFLMIIINGEGIQIGTADTSSSHTFSISRTDVPVVKIDKKYLIQPDWNQNDETAADFVKNRPFYSETGNVTVENAIGHIVLERFPVFAIGDTVTVNVDGVEHSLVAYEDAGNVAIGDPSSSFGSGEGQFGWAIYVVEEVVKFYAKEVHTVSYLGIDYHHKIDPKYLPASFKPDGKSYLTFSSLSSFTLAVGDATKHWNGILEYFSSDRTWTVWDGTTTLSSVNNDGEYVLYLRGTGNSMITENSANYRWVLSGSNISCIGNIENLLNYATVASGEHPTMANYCYANMFRGCTSLTKAPALPATTMANYCYSNMFYGCTNLTTAPALPATTMADHCYYYMFYGCTSLIQAPALPATTMAIYCYANMFRGCTSLIQVPALPTTTLANSCYERMFYGCTNLTKALDLPATTLAVSCYSNMFYGCTNLTTAPALPATTIAVNCYSNMFRGCTSLTKAPALPATTMANYCYSNMFYGCISLIQVPALPATTMADHCYYYMFYGCTSLKLSSVKTDEYTQEYCIPSSGTGTTATNALTNMFTSTGGTFTGTPKINTTYYLSSDNMIARDTEITTLNGYVESMIEGLATQKYVDGKVPNEGTTGQILKKTETGTEWADESGGSSSTTQTITLLTSGWAQSGNGYSQTVNVTGVTASSNGSLRIAQSATDEQFAAWGAAKPRVTAQAAGTLTVKAAGTVPTIDIPVEVLIV